MAVLWCALSLSIARNAVIDVSPTRRVHGPGTKSCKPMAWRPYGNLIDGELDNRIPGKVTGWLRFHRYPEEPLRVTLELAGDFHEDIRGMLIRLTNPHPSDRYSDRTGSYMDGFAAAQHGTVGDITAGISLGPWTDALAQKLMQRNELLWDEQGIKGIGRDKPRQEMSERYRRLVEAGGAYVPYTDYPYVEWYAENGRVVLELDPSQVEIVDRAPKKPKNAAELLADEEKRKRAFAGFMQGMMKDLSEENRKKGGDGNVTGIVVN